MESEAVAATVADSNQVSIFETAIAVGNPEGVGISATAGYINVDSEEIYIKGSDGVSRIELRVMRTDAAVNSGNSGGGLFNGRGELIGIVNAKTVDDAIDNIGYAIPSNVAKAIAENILYYCEGGNTKSVHRVMLGITVTHKDVKASYDTATGRVVKSETVYVDSLTDTSAMKGYIEAGDVINSITIDGVTNKVTRMFHVVDSMLNARPGSTVVMNITRNGAVMDVTVTVTQSMLVEYK
jgi:serine protease Do